MSGVFTAGKLLVIGMPQRKTNHITFVGKEYGGAQERFGDMKDGSSLHRSQYPSDPRTMVGGRCRSEAIGRSNTEPGQVGILILSF